MPTKELPISMILRAQSWERAKGELESMRPTFLYEEDGSVMYNAVELDSFDGIVKRFIQNIESAGFFNIVGKE